MILGRVLKTSCLLLSTVLYTQFSCVVPACDQKDTEERAAQSYLKGVRFFGFLALFRQRTWPAVHG